MTRHTRDRLMQSAVEAFCLSLQLRERHGVGEWVPTLRSHSLTEQHGDPAGIGEELTIMTSYLAARAEQLDAMCERVRNRHVATPVPEGLRTLVRDVVQ